jgi:arabinan endo-1,5-alpha-L-arabinosidase
VEGVVAGFRQLVGAAQAVLVVLGASPSVADPPLVNPLVLHAESVGPVTSCADPTVVRWPPPGDDAWYMVCTSDPLSGADRDAHGGLRYRLLPTFRSEDLLEWEYVGDALEDRPVWAEPSSALWAPELDRRDDGTYALYFAATDARDFVSGEPGCPEDSAIGVATAASPLGPWTVHDEPVVSPRRAGDGCEFLSTIDPEVARDGSGQGYLLFGGYRGGIVSRRLSPDGLLAPAATETQLTSARYEAPEVYSRDGAYYLFASPNGCCNGDLTGYSVMAGRAQRPDGPYRDRAGQPLTAGRTGGTPVLAANGGGYVGPGHASAFADRDGTDWMLYHAVSRTRPFFEEEPGFTRRPVLLDPLVWDAAGWPSVRGGWGTGECAQPPPAAREGETSSAPAVRRKVDPVGAQLPAYSDEFDDGLGPAWSWVREPPAGTWGLDGGSLWMETQGTELHRDSNTAPVLVHPAPPGDFVVETELRFDLPAEGCCWDFAQAGVVLYAGDDRYLKLVHVSIGATRQTEFGKEVPSRGEGWPRFGGSGAGPPGTSTVLRITRRVYGEEERYTAYSRADGGPWVRSSTWIHRLGDEVRLGLVAMNHPGFTARFERVTTYALPPYPCDEPSNADPCRASPPGEVRPVRVNLVDAGAAGEAARISWDPDVAATVYDVSRAELAALDTGDYGPCLANDLTATELLDHDVPAAGAGFAYLVRGADPLCGWSGPWGNDRDNEHPEACP